MSVAAPVPNHSPSRNPTDDGPSLASLSLADSNSSSMDSSPEDLVRRYSADVFAFTSKRLEEWKAEVKFDGGDAGSSPAARTSSPSGRDNSKPGTPTSPRKETSS